MRSIKSILIKYFLILLLAIFTLASLIEYLQYRSYISHFQNNALQKSNVLANNLQATLLFESKKDFDDLVRDQDAISIQLFNAKGLLFAGKGEVLEPSIFNKDISWQDDQLITKSKVSSGDEVLGHLYVKYSTDEIYNLIQSQLFYVVLGYGFLFISFLIILKTIDTQLTTPIKKLSEFVKKLSMTERLSSRVDTLDVNIETKDLKDSFNRLLDNIEEKNNSLSDLNLNLEHKVSEKTLELQEAIEDLKKYQDQIIAQEKLASLGSLAAGIAHEIKNPINLINNSALIIDMFSERNIVELKKKIDDGNYTKADLEELTSDLNDIMTASRIISNNGKRADGIIKSMLLLSRSQKATAIEGKFSHHLEQALNLSFHAMRAKQASIDVIINKDIQETDEVLCYPQDLERAFVNIFDNAFYAMKERKNVSTDYKAQLDVDLKINNKNAEITIKDNGVGIPDSEVTKIFEPFFTTKPAGSGTGLGMSMVNDIIIAHKGELKISSEKDTYTEVKIKLPLS